MTQPKLADLSRWGIAKSEGEARGYVDPRDIEKRKEDRKHEVRIYPSVTTVLKLIDKSDLMQWAANLTIEWAAENWHLLGTRSPEDAVRAGKYRWKDVRNLRAAVGDGIHETIEAEHRGLWEFPALDDEQKRIMDRWRELNQKHDIEPVHSELTVYDTDLGYAGTLDGLWKIDGELTLVDIKTSRKTWPDHYYQLGALWSAPEWAVETEEDKWDVIPAQDVGKVSIVHLREDHAEVIPVNMNLMPAYTDVFRSYLGAWYAHARLKDLEKKEAGF